MNKLNISLFDMSSSVYSTVCFHFTCSLLEVSRPLFASYKTSPIFEYICKYSESGKMNLTAECSYIYTKHKTCNENIICKNTECLK